MDAFSKLPAVSQPSMDSYIGAFQAIHRLLNACNNAPIISQPDDLHENKVRSNCGWSATGGLSSPSRKRVASSGRHGCLTDLAHAGPYLAIAAFLDMPSINSLDASCHLLWALNRGFCGPWFAMGVQSYRGIELADLGAFESSDEIVSDKFRDWKHRALCFRSEVRNFRSPFYGRVISEIEQPDEIAYCCCQLRTDVLMQQFEIDGGGSIFMHFEVFRNPDNVSLAVFDFEEGGCSSVTFSPDTGAVIRERKVNEEPRKVEGAYIQPLVAITDGQCFEGSMGLYFSGGHLAFFRKRAPDSGSEETNAEESEVETWETTGFVTDLSWAEGNRLTPCLAFRNEGLYGVRVISVGRTPPIAVGRNAAAYAEVNWSSLDWDATEQDDLDE